MKSDLDGLQADPNLAKRMEDYDACYRVVGLNHDGQPIQELQEGSDESTWDPVQEMMRLGLIEKEGG